jgi:hypothetical protein
VPKKDGGDGSRRELDADVVESLSNIVGREARRFLSEAQLEPDPVLKAAGWERRFVADARRADEAIELYTQLGYEVRTEPVLPEELGDECEDCQLVAAFKFKTIYTRKQRTEGAN